MWENSMSKLCEVIEGKQKKESLSRHYTLQKRPCGAVDCEIGSKGGNQAKPLKYSEKKSCIS